MHHCVGPLQLPTAGSCTCSFIQLVIRLHTDERMHDHMLKNSKCTSICVLQRCHEQIANCSCCHTMLMRQL